MLSTLKTKIRGLIEDFSKSDFQIFEYETSSIFTLRESNIDSIDKVLKNGVELGSGDYSYDSTTNKIEILAFLNSGDKIEVDFHYYKYSDSELKEYIQSALVYISLESYGSETDYEIEDDDIYPTPDNKTVDLIAIVGAILIKPDYTYYKLPTVTVRYPGDMTKEQRIQELVSRFNRGLGLNDVLEFD